MDLMKTNFYKNVSASNSGIKEKRALNLVRHAEMQKRRIIESLEADRFELEAQYEELNDFGPKTTVDLNASKNVGKIDEWAQRTHELAIKMRENGILLEIAREEYKNYFGTQYKRQGEE